MEDKEIVKALKEILKLMLCEGDLQRSATISNALDLINRLEAEKEVLEARIGVYETCNARKDEAIKHLEAENERLKAPTTDWLVRGISPEQLEKEKIQALMDIAKKYAKAEAYKEFAERLKDGTGYYDEMIKDVVYTEEEVDNLLKELVGEDDESKN